MNKRHTIAHLIATNFYGGPEKQIATHALTLDPSRFRFILFSFLENGDQNELIEIARSHGCEVVELPTGNPFSPYSIKLVVDALRKYHIDLLCVHGYKSNVIGRLATWLSGVGQISISRGWTAENSRIRFYEKLDRLFLHVTDHIVAVSQGQKDKILKLGIRSDKVSVIHNAISLNSGAAHLHEPLRAQLGIPADAMIIASAGRLSPEKNYAGMITVAERLCSQNQQAYFVVFGEGFLRAELEKKICAVNLNGRFLLPGFRKDLQSIFPEIDIFMLPSFTEGLPNVALEAFANKKPIVATKVGGTPEVVIHGVSGYLTAPEDISGMEKHVRILLNDANLRTQFGTAGYAHIQEHFSFDSQTAAYEQLYLDMLETKSRDE